MFDRLPPFAYDPVLGDAAARPPVGVRGRQPFGAPGLLVCSASGFRFASVPESAD
jgi:hypothetical protein